MRLDDYLKGEVAEIEHCTARRLCPFGHVCGTLKSEGSVPLFPTVLEVGKGEMLWTDIRFEQRVFVIKDGLFVCIAQEAKEGELPYALYGTGIVIGAIELYAPREISSLYHLRALLPSKVCSFSLDAVKSSLNKTGSTSVQSVVSGSTLNQSCAMFLQIKVMSRQSLRDRIILQLLTIHEVLSRSRKNTRTLKITHEELAYLVGSDRVSVTRTLNALRDDGFISLGYVSITLNDKLFELTEVNDEVKDMFYVQGDDSENLWEGYETDHPDTRG